MSFLNRKCFWFILNFTSYFNDKNTKNVYFQLNYKQRNDVMDTENKIIQYKSNTQWHHRSKRDSKLSVLHKYWPVILIFCRNNEFFSNKQCNNFSSPSKTSSF